MYDDTFTPLPSQSSRSHLYSSTYTTAAPASADAVATHPNRTYLGAEKVLEQVIEHRMRP